MSTLRYPYPSLTSGQQKTLPVLIKPPVRMPSKFEDSTHQLWQCESLESQMVLKVCDRQGVEQSVFWQGMNRLFDAHFPDALDSIAQIHQIIAEAGTLSVPGYIASEKAAFVLTSFLAGKDVVEAVITDDLVVKLAEHIASLHLQKVDKWGKLFQPELMTVDWSLRLEQTLLSLANSNEKVIIPKTVLDKAISQAKRIQPTSFCPIMLDLRWDQLRILNNGQLAVIDMDAFVIGPSELELVLIEYLLSADQLRLFQETYQAFLPVPDLSIYRHCYRVLLFLMNVLGEKNISQWLSHDNYFVVGN